MTKTVESFNSMDYDKDRYDKTVRRTRRIVSHLWGVNVIGIENVPQDGAAIIDISHRSVLDPWLIAAGIAEARRVRGMVKKETLNWYYFGLGKKYLAPRGVFFVDRGSTSRETWKLAADILRAGEAVAMAEEGTYRINGPVLGEAKDGVYRLSAKLEAEGIPCPVVPVGMNTENLIFHPGRTVNFVVAEALRPKIEVGANVKQQREAAEELRDRGHASLQRAFDISNGLFPVAEEQIA